jgi:hypothetical protein
MPGAPSHGLQSNIMMRSNKLLAQLQSAERHPRLRMALANLKLQATRTYAYNCARTLELGVVKTACTPICGLFVAGLRVRLHVQETFSPGITKWARTPPRARYRVRLANVHHSRRLPNVQHLKSTGNVLLSKRPANVRDRGRFADKHIRC